MNEEKIEPKIEEKKEETKKVIDSKWRELIIKTNGTDIRVEKSELAGNLEFVAILQSLLSAFSKKQ